MELRFADRPVRQVPPSSDPFALETHPILVAQTKRISANELVGWLVDLVTGLASFWQNEASISYAAELPASPDLPPRGDLPPSNYAPYAGASLRSD